jgi:predicted transcriptional regulator of viral defense system
MTMDWSAARTAVAAASPCTPLEAARAAGGIATLRAMTALGVVEERGNRVRVLRDTEHPHERMASVAMKHPHTLLCMHSAAWFHGLADGPPELVHLAFAIDANPFTKDKRPDGVAPYKWSTQNHLYGVDKVEILGVNFRMTDKPRTVLDLIGRSLRPAATPEVRELATEALKRYTETAPVFRIEDVAKKLGKAQAAKWAREHASTPSVPSPRAP